MTDGKELEWVEEYQRNLCADEYTAFRHTILDSLWHQLLNFDVVALNTINPQGVLAFFWQMVIMEGISLLGGINQC